MIKRFIKCIKEYKFSTIMTPILVAIECVFDILIPLIMGELLDKGVKQNDTKAILIYGAILVAMAIAALYFGAMSGKTCAKASTGFAKNLRKEMFDRIQTYSFKNIDDFSPSSLVTRMTTDVQFVQNAFMMIIRVAVRSPLMLIFGIIMTIIVGGSLAWIFAIVVPVMALLLLLIFKMAFPKFEKLFKRYDKLNNVVEENIRGMRVVKSNVREDYEIEKFTDASQNIYDDFSSAKKIVAFASPIMQLGMYVCIGFIAWLGANLAITSGETALTAIDLQMLITYSSSILISLMMFSIVYVNISISKASADRIIEVLNCEPDIVNPSEPITNVVDGSIDFNDVGFSYAGVGGVESLSDVNLHINSGEVIGVIGSTGSSKTTFVQLIPRLYDVTRGEIKVGGVNVKDYDLVTLRKNVAMVLQKNVLFSGTVRENLKWGDDNATDDELNNALKLACADEFIDRIGGLDGHIEQGGSNISGGQRQRLCIARALVSNPKILVLDDSTSAVDMNTDKLIRKAFKNYIPDTTKIIIAQRVVSVMDADKIIVLDGGKIVAVGNHKELMDSCDIYREVYTSQQAGGDFDGQ